MNPNENSNIVRMETNAVKRRGSGEMISDAKRRADAKYRSEKTKQLVVRFFPSDMEVMEYAKSQENTTQYIKNLIRADMEKSQQK